MARRRKSPAHDSDYDGAWKALLRTHLRELLEKYFPALVVLADLREDWYPGEDLFRVADFESRLRFPTCKLIQKLETDWRDDHSLPVQVARAQIEALKTSGDPEGRYRAKWRLVRNLYELG